MVDRSYTTDTATLLSDATLLVAGGLNTGYLASAEVYNPGTEVSTATGNLVVAGGYHTPTLLANGKVLVASGYGFSGYLARAE